MNGSIAYAPRRNPDSVSEHGLAVWDMLEPALITAIEPATNAQAETVPGPPIWDAASGAGSLERESDHFFRIRLSLPESARLVPDDETTFWFSVSHEHLLKGKDRPHAVDALLFAVDEDHLMMQVSLTPSWHDLIKATPAIQRSFKRRQPLKGMNRSMIVRLLGFPSYVKRRSEQERSDFWLWDGPMMHTYGVQFGSNNQVTWCGELYYKLP